MPTFSQTTRRGRCPHRPKGSREFAGAFRKIGSYRRVDVLNRPLRGLGQIIPVFPRWAVRFVPSRSASSARRADHLRASRRSRGRRPPGADLEALFAVGTLVKNKRLQNAKHHHCRADRAHHERLPPVPEHDDQDTNRAGGHHRTLTDSVIHFPLSLLKNQSSRRFPHAGQNFGSFARMLKFEPQYGHLQKNTVCPMPSTMMTMPAIPIQRISASLANSTSTKKTHTAIW